MEFFHVLNRGVEKRNIFQDNADYERFALGLELFNDKRPIDNIHRLVNGSYVRLTKSNSEELVEVHAWCLMRNHYHLLVTEKVEGGITKFLRKLNIGYSKYFNEKYKRSGTLFQGRTKKVPVVSDPHYMHIVNYIHLNPLDYSSKGKNWREGKLVSAEDAFKYLHSYPWSSFHDYCGESKFSNITTTRVFKEGYEVSLKRYLKDIELGPIASLLLE